VPISTQTNKVLYAGSGLTVYPYTFKIFSASDLVVIRRGLDGGETTLTLTTDYTVSGVGSDSGGNVTLAGVQAASPPASGEKLLIKRVIPLIQSTEWQDNDEFPAATINNAVDRLTCLAQQLQEQLDRAAKREETSDLNAELDVEQIASYAATAASAAAEAAAYLASLSVKAWYVEETGTPTRASASTFTLIGYHLDVAITDRPIFLDQTNPARGWVSTASYNSGTGLTTVTVTGCSIDEGLTSVWWGQEPSDAPRPQDIPVNVAQALYFSNNFMTS
jgi:hypothetical protein